MKTYKLDEGIAPLLIGGKMNFHDKYEKIVKFANENNIVIKIEKDIINQNFWTNYDLMARIDTNLNVNIEKTFDFDNVSEKERKEIDKLIVFLKELGFKEGE